MALIKCPECGVDNISDNATACPHCGYNLASHKRKESFAQKRIQFRSFFQNKKTRRVIDVIAVLAIVVYAFNFYQQTKYDAFSGEYSLISGSDQMAPNTIEFDADGTGHYYIGGGPLTGFYHSFDYKITSDSSIKIYDCLANPPIRYINGECLVYVEDGRTHIVLGEIPNNIYIKR